MEDIEIEDLVSAEARQLFSIWGVSDFSSLDEGHVAKFLVEVMWHFNMQSEAEKMDLKTILWILRNAEDYLNLFEIKLAAMGFNSSLIRGDAMDLWNELGENLPRVKHINIAYNLLTNIEI